MWPTKLQNGLAWSTDWQVWDSDSAETTAQAASLWSPSMRKDLPSSCA